jgi:hypothetical protein
MGHELRLHRPVHPVPQTYSPVPSSSYQQDAEQCVSEIAHVVDVLVSLQLGTSSSDFFDDVRCKQHAKPPSPVSAFPMLYDDVSHGHRFRHVITLCRIISRIQIYLGLPMSTSTRFTSLNALPASTMDSSTIRQDDLAGLASLSDRRGALESELEDWHRALPGALRVSVGEKKATRAVLELNLLHCVAVILLWWPWCGRLPLCVTSFCLTSTGPPVSKITMCKQLCPSRRQHLPSTFSSRNISPCQHALPCHLHIQTLYYHASFS